MDRVRIVISYNGRWEQLPDGNQRYLGSDNQGLYVSKNLSYDELVSNVQTIVKFDENKYSADLYSKSIGPGTTCRTFIRNNDDVQFMLGENRVIPQVCVSLIERPAGGGIGEDIPHRDNTQQFRSSENEEDNEDDKEPVQTERRVRHVHRFSSSAPDIVETLPNVGVIHEGNFNSVENEEDNEDDKEPVQTERRVRHVHRFSSSAPDIVETSEVRANITPYDSDNTTTWVIPGAESYSFGMGGSRNLVEDEPTSMIYKVYFFPTKKDLRRLVGHFAMWHNFEWKVKRSNKTTLHLVCLMENCTWKLIAVRRDEGTYFQVRSFVNEHTCPLEEIHRRHRQVSAVIIGEVIAPRLQQQDGRLMRPKDIIVDMKSMYGIQIMYIKAHTAFDYALSRTHGTHEETFQLLPSFGYVLEQKNPGTITDLQCDKDGKFLLFFMSIGASLREFRTCMRPVIAVDGTHLKGRFQGTMFVTTTQDGNEHVYPIAFGHVSIEAGISKVFPYATHTICCWHFAENIKKQFYRKDVATIMEKAARAYTKFEYNRHIEELRNLHQNVYDYVIDAGPHKWSRVHCPERRYRDHYRAVKTMRHQLTDAAHLVLLKRVEKCGFFTVNPIDWNIFSVKQSRKQWTVDLARKTCTCNKFQMDHFRCSHALAATRYITFKFYCEVIITET
ncbi:hypothetical protein Ddye_021962 [Dipteronia dyeriana]|uniref:SWIM-type domain-containing protein n=1 Tax=Dipteronia dyeriana TaxID=168575 RepID=A0AAD9U358_9ROSI|nr:hypothetical protein Ddye_021962 [Dipteronia dyeriana]